MNQIIAERKQAKIATKHWKEEIRISAKFLKITVKWPELSTTA